jgi:hypothetical protein
MSEEATAAPQWKLGPREWLLMVLETLCPRVS